MDELAHSPIIKPQQADGVIEPIVNKIIFAVIENENLRTVC